MDPSLETKLRNGAAAFGVELDARFTTAAGRYLDLLWLWNQRLNLTAVRDRAAMIERHFVDSLAVVPHIPAEAQTLADIGSGAGFPGAIIALARPTLRVSLVESIHKKAAFLEALRRELPLPNVQIHAERAEAWAARAPKPDILVSRAVWDVSDWLALASTWVKPGGLILAMEGAQPHPLPPHATRHPYPPGTHAIITYHPERST